MLFKLLSLFFNYDLLHCVEFEKAYTNSSPLSTPKEDNKGTHLELDIVLELTVKGNSKKVFGTINETVIGKNKIPRPDFRVQRVETFTDFIQGIADILKTYEDTALAEFFYILDEEIRKYHYRGCKFYELTEDYEFRSLLAEKLDLIKRKSVPVLKTDISELVAIIRHEKYGKNVKELLDYINSLYREDVAEKFQKVLSDLKTYGNTTSKTPKKYLVKVIRDGVRAIVFNHYTDLNINVRRELKKVIAIFLKKIKKAPSSRSKTDLFLYKPAVTESENTAKRFGYDIVIKDVKPELSLKIDPTSTTDDNNIFIVKTSDEKLQEGGTKLETSKEESTSQQLQITYLSTDESSDETVEGNSIELSQKWQRKLNSQPYSTLYTEDLSYKNTVEPEIINRSAMSSKLAKRMLVEKPSGRLPILQPTTTPGIRLRSYKELRRSIAPPMPEEELSIEVFDRERKKKEEKTEISYKE